MREEKEISGGRRILPLLFFACLLISPAIVQHRKVVAHSHHNLGSRKQLLRLEVVHHPAVHRSSQPQQRHCLRIQRQGIHRTEQLMLPGLVLDHPGHP